MRIFASLKIAGRALRRNKMRSLLTMLGVIIGVGAVIGSVSLTGRAAWPELEYVQPVLRQISELSFRKIG